MGFRFRKSFKIAPGVRVNVGKKSIGISAGVKGARVSVNSSGRKTTTVGLPGTGLSYSKTEKIGGAKKAQTGGFDDLPKTDGVEEAFSATNSQQYTTRPDLPPAKPQEVKDKSGCGGCLTIIVAALIFFALLSSCFGGSDDKQTNDDASAADTTQTEQVDAEQQAAAEQAAKEQAEKEAAEKAAAEQAAKEQAEKEAAEKAAAEQAAKEQAEKEAKEQAEKEAAEKAAAEQAAAAAAAQAAQEQAAAQQSETVYITPSGKRWHRSASCAGKNAREVTMDQVGNRTPCKKCA